MTVKNESPTGRGLDSSSCAEALTASFSGSGLFYVREGVSSVLVGTVHSLRICLTKDLDALEARIIAAIRDRIKEPTGDLYGDIAREKAVSREEVKRWFHAHTYLPGPLRFEDVQYLAQTYSASKTEIVPVPVKKNQPAYRAMKKGPRGKFWG